MSVYRWMDLWWPSSAQHQEVTKTQCKEIVLLCCANFSVLWLFAIVLCSFSFCGFFQLCHANFIVLRLLSLCCGLFLFCCAILFVLQLVLFIFYYNLDNHITRIQWRYWNIFSTVRTKWTLVSESRLTFVESHLLLKFDSLQRARLKIVHQG